MSGFLRRMLNVLLVLFALVLVVALGLLLYAWREAGTAPSDAQLARYAHLPYFQDGRFQAWQELPYMPEKKAGQGSFGSPATPNRPPRPFPMVTLTRADFASAPAQQFTYYWLGHASALIEMAGVRFIVDPVFGNASPLPFLLPRFQPPPLAREELPPLDFVLITHDHYDHLEAATIRHFARQATVPRFIVPLGLGVRLQGWGIPADKITELGWAESTTAGALTLTAEPALHYSQRFFGERGRTLWAAYVLQSPAADGAESVGERIFIAGDSGYSEHFQQIGQKYGGFDAALIEIDAGNPGWPHTHLFPAQAVQAAQDLNAALMLPVHWGAYDMALHPWGESIRAVRQEAARVGVNLQIPKMGERFQRGDVRQEEWWQ